MNVPISARERIKAREHLTEKYDSTNIKNEEKPQSKKVEQPIVDDEEDDLPF